MSKRMMLGAIIIAIGAGGFVPPPVAAEKLRFVPIHGTDERRCLADLIAGRWNYSPEVHPEMMATAKLATANLHGVRRRGFFYLFDGRGWCGTAGCILLIGEARPGASCRLLYEVSGFEGAIETLRVSDHGYRRLYTPCETRFNGKEYWPVREECPTLDVQR
jgi:hypothetical protein